MANTYSKIYIHAVFAVKYRQSLITKDYSADLHSYMGGIIKSANQIPIIINGVADHVHLAFMMKPAVCVSDLMRLVKSNSSKWINDHKLTRCKFSWQRGFGAFSYGYSQTDMLYRYIENQEQHHRRKTFKREYLALLDSFAIEHQEEFLFDWIMGD